MRAVHADDRHAQVLKCIQWCWEGGKGARFAVQAIWRAREAQAAAAALPPGAPRPVPTFTELAAELAPLRMFEDVVSAARSVKIVGLRDNG